MGLGFCAFWEGWKWKGICLRVCMRKEGVCDSDKLGRGRRELMRGKGTEGREGLDVCILLIVGISQKTSELAREKSPEFCYSVPKIYKESSISTRERQVG